MPADAHALAGVDAATLTPMVRELLNEPGAVVAGEWSCRPLGGGAGEGLGLYRVTGSARVSGASRPWALVVKICAAAAGAEPEAWDYPARERLAYGSGLLSLLPGGLGAPRCLAVESQPDGSTRLWLEEVTDAHPGSWPRSRYARAAHCLGHFNGTYLVGAPLPDQQWLSRGWLRDFVEPSATFISDLASLASPEGSPLLQRLYPPPVVSEIERLWRERESFLITLDQLPRTFCHHDAFRRNLMLRAGPAGEELVAVDWAYAGHGAIGEELGQLVVASLFFFEAEGTAPRELDAACFAGYVAGLREAGWAGDERVVRLGFTAAAALRHTVGLLHLLLPVLSDPVQHPVVAENFGRPPEAAVESWAALWQFQFGLAEEARTLLLAVG